MAFSPCPEAGSGDANTRLTLNYLYFLNDLFTNKYGRILESKNKLNSKVIFKKAYIPLHKKCSYIQVLHNISKIGYTANKFEKFYYRSNNGKWPCGSFIMPS